MVICNSKGLKETEFLSFSLINHNLASWYRAPPVEINEDCTDRSNDPMFNNITNIILLT